MTMPREWWKGPWRYAGLLLMGLGVIAGLVTGILAFERLVTVETAYSAMAVSFFVFGLPGFVLHMITVVTVVRMKRRNDA